MYHGSEFDVFAAPAMYQYNLAKIHAQSYKFWEVFAESYFLQHLRSDPSESNPWSRRNNDSFSGINHLEIMFQLRNVLLFGRIEKLKTEILFEWLVTENLRGSEIPSVDAQATNL